MHNKTQINGDMPHRILPIPESWKRWILRGSTGVSSVAPVESITFLQPTEKFNELVAERQARPNEEPCR